jgi:hypothetical protein
MPDFATATLATAESGLAQFGQQVLSVLVPLHGLHDVLHGLNTIVAAGNTVLAAFFSGIKNVGAALWKHYDAVSNVSGAVKWLTGGFENLGAKFGVVGAVFGAVGSVVGAMVSTMASVAGAAVEVAGGLFQLALAATPGGLQIFGDAITYLTAVIGSALAPAAVAVIAALLTLADMVKGEMASGFQKVSQWLVTTFATTLPRIIKNILDFGDTLASVTLKIVSAVTLFASIFFEAASKLLRLVGADRLGGAAHQASGMLESLGIGAYGLAQGRDKAIADREKEARKPGGGEFANLVNSFGEGFKKNFGKVVDASAKFQGQQGNVGFSGIADVAKQIQMQSFQNDLQGDILKAGQSTVSELQQLNKQIQNIKLGPQPFGR